MMEADTSPSVILIAGPAGAGKTTMAKRIGNEPGWVALSEDEFWNRLPREPHTFRTDVEKAIVQGMVGNGTLTKEVYHKVKKPFADTLYVLGVKSCDTYLPSDEEIMAMIEQGKAAAQAKEPSAEDKKRLADAGLATAKTEQIKAEMSGTDSESQLDYMAMAAGTPKVYS